MKKIMFAILDKEYEEFYTNQKGNFGRPLRLENYLNGGDFSCKSWHGTLNWVHQNYILLRIEILFILC